MSDVVILGYGYTRVGEHWNKDIIDLAYEAAKKALSMANVDSVDAIYVGNMLSEYLELQGHLGAYIASELGLDDTPAVRVDAADASGAYAIVEAIKAVKTGEYKTVLVGGVEKLTDSLPAKVFEGMTYSEDRFTMNMTGLTNAGICGILARLYMNKYKVDRRSISYISVLDHENSVNAEHAHFRNKISIEAVLSSPMIADPLTLLDTSPICDGAAFIVVTSSDDIKEGCVKFLGYGVSTQNIIITQRDDILYLKATYNAVKKALKMANLNIENIDVAEIHDSYSILGVLALEALGIDESGTAAIKLSEGVHNLKGEKPINTFGGLKARGHPLGATGVYQVIEVAMQLTGRAGLNQVENTKYGLIHSMGDTTSVVIILGFG